MLRVASTLFGVLRPAHSPFRIQERNSHKKAIPVHWERPQNGWTKLNFDGSCKGQKGVSSIGGVARNHRAEFLLGYAEPISATGSAVVAELAALRRGLELARENRWRNLWIEGDAESVVHIIMQLKKVKRLKCSVANRHVSEINMMIPKIKNFKLSHVHREGNRVADKLARMGHGLEKPKVWRHDPPDDDVLLRIVREDAVGKIIIRRR